MTVVGQGCHELEVAVSASSARDLYDTLKLSRLAQKANSDRIQKVEFLHGDGVGTLLRVTFHPGRSGYTKVDHKKRVKEVEMIEGGLLDLGLPSTVFASTSLITPPPIHPVPPASSNRQSTTGPRKEVLPPPSLLSSHWPTLPRPPRSNPFY